MSAMSTQTSCKNGGPGLGIFFSEEKNQRHGVSGWEAGSMVVSSLLAGSAAEKLGVIKTGDRLWAVAGQPVVGLKPQVVVDLISAVSQRSSGASSINLDSLRHETMHSNENKENMSCGHSSADLINASGLPGFNGGADSPLGVELTLQRLDANGSAIQPIAYTVHIPRSSSNKRRSAARGSPGRRSVSGTRETEGGGGSRRVARTSRHPSSSEAQEASSMRRTRSMGWTDRDAKADVLSTEEPEPMASRKRAQKSAPLPALNSPRNGSERLRRGPTSAHKRQRQDPSSDRCSASEPESSVVVKRNGTLVKRGSVDGMSGPKLAEAEGESSGSVHALRQDAFAKECNDLRATNAELMRRVEELERKASAGQRAQEGAAQREDVASEEEARRIAGRREGGEQEATAAMARTHREVEQGGGEREAKEACAEEEAERAAVWRLRAEVDRDKEELGRERVRLVSEMEAVTKLQEEVARRFEEVRVREEEAQTQQKELQARAAAATRGGEAAVRGAEAVVQLQKRLKMAVGSARMATEEMDKEHAAWQQIAALLSVQVSELAVLAKALGGFGQEVGEELKSMEADRVFLEAEILRQQEKQEKLAERLRGCEELRVKAEQDVSELRRVVAKEEREREAAEEEARREQEGGERERERLRQRVEELEEGQLEREALRSRVVKLEGVVAEQAQSRGRRGACEGCQAAICGGRELVGEVGELQRAVEEMKAAVSEEARAQRRASVEGQQRQEELLRGERRRHSAIVAELRTELKRALQPPSISPSPQHASADSFSLSDTTPCKALRSNPRPQPDAAGPHFLLPADDGGEAEAEGDSGPGHRLRLRSLLPADAPREGREPRGHGGERAEGEGEGVGGDLRQVGALHQQEMLQAEQRPACDGRAVGRSDGLRDI